MRILSVRVYQEDNITKIQIEKIKPRDYGEGDYYGDLNKLQSHLSTYFRVNHTPRADFSRTSFNARTEKKDDVMGYEYINFTIAAPTDPGELFKLIVALDKFFKENEHYYNYDYLLFDKESIANYIKPPARKFDSDPNDRLIFMMYHQAPADTIATLSIPVKEFVANVKPYTAPNKNKASAHDFSWDNFMGLFSVFTEGNVTRHRDEIHVNENLVAAREDRIATDHLLIAEYLERALTKLYPAYTFLESFKLAYADLSSFSKDVIFRRFQNSMQAFMDIPKQVVNAFTDTMKLEFLKPCLKEPTKAHDGGYYNLRYTEIQLLLDADIVMRADGRLSINLTNNKAYQEFYAEGKRNHGGLLKEELAYLGNILDFQLDLDSDYDKELIFTNESTNLLLKRYLGVKDQLLQQVKPIPIKLETVSATTNTAPLDVEKTEPALSLLSGTTTLFNNTMSKSVSSDALHPQEEITQEAGGNLAAKLN